jgi:hypothetical protein
MPDSETCFVVMAIGPQKVGDSTVTAETLRDNYVNVIKTALERARPGILVERADDCSSPGTISTDILTHLMFDTIVVVDVTFPNPNVFYELGVRHACKPGTVLIRDKSFADRTPFDISHQRYFEYECTPKGVGELADKFRDYFTWFDKNAETPDNQLLQLARLIKYSFPQYGEKKAEKLMDAFGDFAVMMLQSPETMQALQSPNATDQEKQRLVLKLLASNPEMAKQIFRIAMTPN